MAATTTLASNGAKVTVSGTSDNTIDCDACLSTGQGEALIEWVSGTTIQFNSFGPVVATSIAINSTQTKIIIPVTKGDYIHCKGGAGSETFNITIISK